MSNQITVPINDPSAKRVEAFLHSISYPLDEVPFDWHSWQLSDHILGEMKFHASSLPQPLILTILVCDSYTQANAIGEANEMLANSNHARWGVNGNILYFAESEDVDKVSEMVSLFADEE
jgi:hypothetical protein